MALFAINTAWAQTVDDLTGNVGGQTLSNDVKVTGTVTLGGTLYIKGNITFDLNGNTVNGPAKTQVFTVSEGSTLTIIDSSPKEGIFKGHANGGGDRGGFAYVYGTLNLERGIISGFKTYEEFGETTKEHIPTQGGGGAVYINDGATFNMSGGMIEKCSTNADKGAVVCAEGAVFIDADISPGLITTFNFSGGTIRHCTSGTGGAVYVHAPEVNKGEAIFNMSGTAKIENCQATSTSDRQNYGGGAVMVAGTANGKGKFVMSGGTITSCKSAGHGCGVLSHGIMNMSGGTITLCHPVTGSSNWSNINYPNQGLDDVFGGGVFLYSAKSTFTMTGGTISYNKAASGGGIMAWGNEEDGMSIFTMDGTGVILGNQALGDIGLGNGGAVYVQTAIFNFINGTLEKNMAVRYGGAININNSATLNLSGNCIIHENRASHGGGISQEQGECKLTLNDPNILIDHNHAEGNADETGNGGGIFIEKGTFTVTAGTISNNTATGCGGGASLRVKRIVGDMTVNITGGTISGNEAGESGGGLDLYADRNYVAGSDDPANTDNGPNHMNDVIVNFEKGTLTGNNAKNGGGIYVHINEANSIAKMNIGTASDSPLITGNHASLNGGGLAMNNGTINIENGSFTDNEAGWNNTAGNGGAIYLGAGEFNVTGNTSIISNDAVNGGGICVENGTVDINNGKIQDNVSKNLGGGLYVYAPVGATRREVKFTGDGVISGNNAKHGGGVCVDGPLDLSIDASVENNNAKDGNGGGICLLRTATMKFGDGLIRSNKATGKVSLNTAHNETFETLQGVGGGVFLDSGTGLSFIKKAGINNFGLYNNSADFAADDIFANGNNTTVNLPAVKSMELKGFEVPTTNLYWVEDYVTNDNGYVRNSIIPDAPTNENVLRYKDAVKDLQPIYHLEEDPGANDIVFTNTYLCMALGYEQAYFHLIKRGLEENDNAAFLIYYPDIQNPGEYIEYRKLYVYGKEDENGNKLDVSISVILPTGTYKIVETVWSSKYTDIPIFTYYDPETKQDKTVNNQTVTMPVVSMASVDESVDKSKINKLTVTNRLKSSFEKVDIRDFEFHKTNLMKP